MNFYKIEQDFTKHESLEGYTGDSIVVLTSEELEKLIKDHGFDKNLVPNYQNAQCCRATVHKDVLSGTFSVLSKDKEIKRKTFGFIIDAHQIMFIDGGTIVSSCIKKISKDKFHHKIKVGRFLYEFLETLVENDLRYLEEMSDRLIKMESAVAQGQTNNFTVPMAKFRKEVLMFYRYYTQLIDVGTELQENENEFFSDEDIKLFRKFTIRATQLQEETKYLREYSNQIRDAFRNQIEMKQNKNMNLLTAVTTMFTPAMIFTAWYGMNFKVFPELDHPYAYPIFIIANILIVVWIGFFLKKKKFW